MLTLALMDSFTAAAILAAFAFLVVLCTTAVIIYGRQNGCTWKEILHDLQDPFTEGLLPLKGIVVFFTALLSPLTWLWGALGAIILLYVLLSQLSNRTHKTKH